MSICNTAGGGETQMGRNTIHVTDNQGGNGWMALYTFFFFVGTKVPNTISTDSTLKLKVLCAELQMTVQVLLTENRKPRLQLAQSYSVCLGKCCLL